MKRFMLLLCALLLASCAGGPTREQDLVARALSAMGGVDALSKVKTVVTQGTVKHWEPEQSDVPGGEMRFAAESSFTTTGDYNARAVRIDWDKKFAYPAPRNWKFSEIVTPDAGYVIGVDSTARTRRSMEAKPPGHSMSGQRLLTAQREMRRASPSLLLEMRASPAKVRSVPDVVVGGVSYPAVSYDAGAYGFIVAFDPQTGLPARVRSLDYDNVWGNVDYDLVLSDWRDQGGVKLPMSQKYELNGRVIGDVQITSVQLNPQVSAALFEIPAAARASAAKPATGNVPFQWVIRRQMIGVYLDSDNPSFDTLSSKGLRLQELAPGVDHFVGGSHNSLLVEMRDHLIVFDAPVTDAQSNALIAAAKAKYPGKPIRYLMLTHHHMDHSGGMRAILAQGAALVVGQGAAAHYRKVLAAPTTRNPDLPPMDYTRVQIIEVANRHVMTDGKREVSAHLTENPHAKSTLIGYVADARIGFVTDIWSPGRDPLPGKITSPLMAVYKAVRDAGIQPLRFAGGHGSQGDYAPLATLAGQ